MRSVPPSLLIFITLQIVVCLILFTSHSAEASMREWPESPVPEYFDINNLGGLDANQLANEIAKKWQNYMIYIGLVLVLPLIYGLVLFILTCCGCCFRCGVHVCPGPCRKLREKNMSLLQIRILSLIPYSLGYAFILVCTALGIAFFLWFLIGEINVRGESFDIGRRAINLPNAVVSDARGLVSVVPEFMNNFVNLIDDVTSFSEAMTQIETLLNTTKSSIDGVMVHLDNNAQAFNKVKNRQLSMVSRANGTMDAVEFGAFDSVFKAANESISSGITSGFDAFDSAINAGLGGVQGAVDGIRTQISAMNTTVADQLNTMVDKLDTFIEPVQNTYKDWLNQDRLNEYEGYVRIGEAVFGVVIILVITVVVALMTCGFLCVFLRLWPCLKCLDCCASLCIIAYAIVGTVCLVLWCLSEDVCSQAEDYLGKVEDSLKLPAIAIPNTGINITIRFSESFIGVLECPEGSNFLDASKLSLDTFGVKDQIRSYEDQFKAGLGNFQISDFLGNAVGNLSDITGGINIADDIGTQVDTLKDSITTAVGGFFSRFPLLLSLDDFKSEDAQFDELNTILAAVGQGPYSKSNISDLAPFYYDTPDTQTPGKIIAQGEGADFDAVVLALNGRDADKDKVWGRLARDNLNAAVAPTGTIEKSLVYNLTRMNVGSPLNVHEIYDDYQMLLIELDELVSSVNETEKYTSSILNLQPAVDALLGTFNATYTNTLSKISQFIEDSVDTVVDRVTATEIFQCGFIGSYYSTVKKSGCGNLKTALGGTAIVSLFMVAALFVMFFIIMFTDCLAFRKASKYGKGYDSDSDSDSEASLDSIKK